MKKSLEKFMYDLMNKRIEVLTAEEQKDGSLKMTFQYNDDCLKGDEKKDRDYIITISDCKREKRKTALFF